MDMNALHSLALGIHYGTMDDQHADAILIDMFYTWRAGRRS